MNFNQQLQEAYNAGYYRALHEELVGNPNLPPPPPPEGPYSDNQVAQRQAQGQAQGQGAPVAHIAPTGTPPPTPNDPTWNGYPTRVINGVTYYYWVGYGPNQNTLKWRSRQPR